MGPGGMVRDSGSAGSGNSGALYARASSGERGGKVVQGRRECRSCVADGEGDNLYRPPMLPEFRDEGDVLFGLGVTFFFTSQVPTESDLDDDESA